MRGPKRRPQHSDYLIGVEVQYTRREGQPPVTRWAALYAHKSQLP